MIKAEVTVSLPLKDRLSLERLFFTKNTVSRHSDVKVKIIYFVSESTNTVGHHKNSLKKSLMTRPSWYLSIVKAANIEI